MLAEISVATVGVLKQQGALVNPVFEKTRKTWGASKLPTLDGSMIRLDGFL